jgi:hypothetical protein
MVFRRYHSIELQFNHITSAVCVFEVPMWLDRLSDKAADIVGVVESVRPVCV